ncbi:hypothetical protein Bca4012_068121 [Brassica carinata]|uniref:Uncharacterized protein n=1 Tax=Brassica carinata TaxID=52824 RepID=A0A8X8B0D6_BRACI|nr:hypothetical protein Bca52824_020334 [Brassica carinata]
MDQSRAPIALSSLTGAVLRTHGLARDPPSGQDHCCTPPRPLCLPRQCRTLLPRGSNPRLSRSHPPRGFSSRTSPLRRAHLRRIQIAVVAIGDRVARELQW